MNVERASVPPASAVDVPAIKEALRRWESARDQHRVVDRRLAQLEGGPERRQAAARDAELLAAALEAGKPAPKGGKHLAEAEQQLVDTRREVDARKLVEQRAWERVEVAFREHADELRSRTDELFKERRDAFLATVDALERALGELEQIQPLKLFVADDGTMGAGYYRAGAGKFATVIDAPPKHALDDTKALASDVIGALRGIGAPPRMREGLNPQAYAAAEGRDVTQPLQPRHLPLYEQGRAHTIGVPGQQPIDAS